MAEYRYPKNIADLVDLNKLNYIKFNRIEYTNAKFVDGNEKKFEQGYKFIDTIILELPIDINIPEGHDWSAGDLFSTAGANVLPGIGDRLAQSLGMNLVGKGTQFLTGGGIDADILKNQYNFKKGRTIINPNTTLIYNGSGVRSLVLNFNLQPVDDKEAIEIERLLSLFRQSSRGVADNWGITFPSVWNIKTSSIQLNRILDLGNQDKAGIDDFAGAIPFVLTNFNPSIKTPFLYHNEYPPEIELMMEFQEISPKYRYKDYK